MANVSIAVAIALLTLSTAYLGMRLTMHPAETRRAKNAYKAGFFICGTAICVLIGLQTHRNGATQLAMSTEMKRIEAKALIANVPASSSPQSAPITPTERPRRKPKKRQSSIVQQSSSGSCSPNIVGNNNSTTCAPKPELTATQQLQQKMPNGKWLTSFSVSSNVLIQTGDLKLLCDGPVLRAGISRINPASFISGSNGPNPSNPNEVVYQLGPETLSPGVPVVVGVYSNDPVHVLAGSLGNRVITLAQ